MRVEARPAERRGDEINGDEDDRGTHCPRQPARRARPERATHRVDTIVAYRPGGSAHVVAHLPQTLRYAAVTAVGNTVVIAGGSLENGTASDRVLAYTPGRGVRAIGRLPAPTTHAAAASLGG